MTEIYVDIDNGDDGNSGGPQDPLQTILAAVELLKRLRSSSMVEGVLTLHEDAYIYLAPSATAYPGAGLEEVATGTGRLFFVGTGVNVLDSGTVTAESRCEITDGAQAWTADEYVGKSFRFTDGTAAHSYRTICRNTATLLTLSARSNTAPTVGDAYEIFEPAAEIDCSGLIVRGHSAVEALHSGVLAESFPVLDTGTIIATCFSNVKLSNVERFDGTCAFTGVELLSLNILALTGGRTYIGQCTGPGLLTLGDSDAPRTAGFGWGLYILPGEELIYTGEVQANGLVSESVRVSNEVWADVHFGSGRTYAVDGGHLSITAGVRMQVGFPSGNRDMVTICEPLGGVGTPASAPLVKIQPGGVLEVANFTEILAPSMAESGIVNDGLLTCTNVAGNRNPIIEVDAGHYAIHTRVGGRTVVGSDMDNSLAGGVATSALAVGTGAGVVAFDSGAGGPIAADDSSQVAADGSAFFHLDDAI